MYDELKLLIIRAYALARPVTVSAADKDDIDSSALLGASIQLSASTRNLRAQQSAAWQLEAMPGPTLRILTSRVSFVGEGNDAFDRRHI